ncbi:MAG TPA: hypothetical protein VNI20_02465, partial [Fimbriimonadaceae bacterium]|nr:hypothetical protein [Fimbriimonadaceae bacterium]
MKLNETHKMVQERYAAAAKAGNGDCCNGSCDCEDPVTRGLYTADETTGLPADAVNLSLGCGNPTA